MEEKTPAIMGCLATEAAYLKCLYKAIILEQIRYSNTYKAKHYNPDSSKYYFSGHWWCQDSYEKWNAHFPWLSLITIKRMFKNLLDNGVLIKRRNSTFGGGNMPNFYRIDEHALSINLIPTPTLSINLIPPTLSINLLPTKYQKDTPLSINLLPTPLYTHIHTHIHSNSLQLREKLSTEIKTIHENLDWLQSPLIDEDFVCNLMIAHYIEPPHMLRLAQEAGRHYALAGKKIFKPVECITNWVIKDLDRKRVNDWREIVARKHSIEEPLKCMIEMGYEQRVDNFEEEVNREEEFNREECPF